MCFCGGPIIDFFTWLLGDIVNADSILPWRIVAMILGYPLACPL